MFQTRWYLGRPATVRPGVLGWGHLWRRGLEATTSLGQGPTQRLGSAGVFSVLLLTPCPLGQGGDVCARTGTNLWDIGRCVRRALLI
jgi:hypothetical protein